MTMTEGEEDGRPPFPSEGSAACAGRRLSLLASLNTLQCGRVPLWFSSFSDGAKLAPGRSRHGSLCQGDRVLQLLSLSPTTHTHTPPHRRSREPSARQSQAWHEERVTGSGQPTPGQGAGRSHFSRHPWAVPVPWAPIQGSRKTLGCPGGAYTPGLFLKGLVTRFSWPSEGAAVLLKALDVGPAGCLAAWKTPE